MYMPYRACAFSFVRRQSLEQISFERIKDVLKQRHPHVGGALLGARRTCGDKLL